MKAMLRNRHRAILAAAMLGLAVLPFSACGPVGVTFSAEQAAINAVLRSPGSNMQPDPTSTQVLQSSVMGERTFVMIYFEGVNQDLGPGKSKCLFLYEVQKSRFGTWQPKGGGGGCENVAAVAPEGQNVSAPAAPNPISISSGQSSTDGPLDSGSSTIYGQVFDETVKSVKATWSDGTISDAQVINGSYLIIRGGQFNMDKVEALNASGEVVYPYQPEIAPGKK